MAELGVNGDSQSGIKLFTMNGGDKWYLRAHAFGNSAELVCPDHLNHVSACSYNLTSVTVMYACMS